MKRLLTIEKTVKYVLPFCIGDSVLVIAPHPDDETIGCGGTIRKLLSSLINIDIVLLTYGGGKKSNIVDIRKKEFLKAISILGNINAIFLGYEDSKLAKNQDSLSRDISKLISCSDYKGILVPYILDYNIDHQVCNYSLAQALKNNISKESYVVMYEAWTPILYPNHYINISREFCIKYAALKCYETQEKYYRITEKSKLLNALRAQLSMRYNLEYMECFKSFLIEDYINMVEGYKLNL